MISGMTRESKVESFVLVVIIILILVIRLIIINQPIIHSVSFIRGLIQGLTRWD